MKLRVLVIEDTPLNLELITEVLEHAGHTVLAATSATAGLTLAKTAAPDVVLMDIRLPDVDGYEATRRIRHDPALRGITVIALTAQAMRGDEEAALAAGCDAYISKPINVRTITAEIERIVKRKPPPAATRSP
ncbi:MAG: response regulator [Gemmatimonadaceae bacterium]